MTRKSPSSSSYFVNDCFTTWPLSTSKKYAQITEYNEMQYFLNSRVIYNAVVNVYVCGGGLYGTEMTFYNDNALETHSLKLFLVMRSTFINNTSG